MTTNNVSRDALRSVAELLGIHITDESLDELLPQIQRAFDSMAKLDDLDLKNVEPAITFAPQTE